MKQSTIFVGNLHYLLTEVELRAAFENFGQVLNVEIILDKWTNRNRGFAFITMGEDDAARSIAALNGTILKGRTLKVAPARPNPWAANFQTSQEVTVKVVNTKGESPAKTTDKSGVPTGAVGG
jgi:RNA recognition motif-containing protein